MSSFNRQHHGQWPQPPPAQNQSGYHPPLTEAPHNVDPHYYDYLHYKLRTWTSRPLNWLKIGALDTTIYTRIQQRSDIELQHKSLSHHLPNANSQSHTEIHLVKAQNGASTRWRMDSMVMTSIPHGIMLIQFVGIHPPNTLSKVVFVKDLTPMTKRGTFCWTYLRNLLTSPIWGIQPFHPSHLNHQSQMNLWNFWWLIHRHLITQDHPI